MVNALVAAGVLQPDSDSWRLVGALSDVQVPLTVTELYRGTRRFARAGDEAHRPGGVADRQDVLGGGAATGDAHPDRG